MSESDKQTKKRKSGLRWLLIVAALLAIGVVLAGGGLVSAIQVENRDAFCASCHTEPETQYYQRSLAAPVDLASAHTPKGVTCIQCHSGPGTAGRMQAISAVAAPDLLAYLGGNYHKPAVVTVPIGDDHCLKCHPDVSSREDFNNHFHAFLPRWQAQAPKDAATCIDCHQAHVTTGSPDAAFLQQATTVAVCQRCHDTLGEE